MDTVLFTMIFTPVISAIVGGAVGVITATTKKHNSKNTAMERGMRALMREELIQYHEKICTAGHCDYMQREHVDEIYKAYHGIGGNGAGTRLYEEIMEVPVK